MRSIENCRVVIHSVPHFGFTDQYDSLARLQKMIGDLDWDQGLRVWRNFNEFPHPIPSKPDVVPSLDDLVDVVIAKNRVGPKSSKDKKSKKGGRWKKKDKGDSKEKKGSGEGDGAEKKIGCKPSCDVASSDVSNQRGDQQGVTVDENGTKKVVIKQFDPNDPKPEIEIKVLIPGPSESVFPTDVNDKDHRDVEPMDVDQSMHQNPDGSPAKSPLKSPSASQSKSPVDRKEEDCKDRESSSPFKQPTAAINILSSAKDFASSVIEKLTSPQVPPNELSSSPSCVTPPPTPVQQGLDFFMKSRANSTLQSTSVDGSGEMLSTDNNDTEKVAEVISSDSQTAFPSSSVDNDETVPKQGDKILDPETNATSSSLNEKSSSLTNENENLSANENIKEEITDTATTTVKKERDPTKPTFRVSCNRVGDNHSFDSSSAAATFGSAVITYFKWSVDLKNFDIEILLNIDNEEVTIGLGITKASLHHRNLVAFGPTSLRATICYNMMRLCRIRNGDFVCDPMCGTSAIPIEGSLNWVNCFFFGGDYHEKGIERSMQNIDALREKRLEEKKGMLKIGTVQWNIENFPLRDECVDVFVSDLPFGYRMGSRTTNRTLYPTLLFAMARTARTGARACLLTEDRKSLITALQATNGLWQRRVILNINMGGLNGFVFLLTRTIVAYTATPTQTPEGEDTADTKCSEASPSAVLEGDDVEGLESAAVPSDECSKTVEDKLTKEKEESMKDAIQEDAVCKGIDSQHISEGKVDE